MRSQQLCEMLQRHGSGISCHSMVLLFFSLMMSSRLGVQLCSAVYCSLCFSFFIEALSPGLPDKGSCRGSVHQVNSTHATCGTCLPDRGVLLLTASCQLDLPLQLGCIEEAGAILGQAALLIFMRAFAQIAPDSSLH